MTPDREAVQALREAVGAVIDRWYKAGLLRFNSHDDGSDDLLLRDEIVRSLPAATPSPDAGEPDDLGAAWRKAEAATDQKMLSVERLSTGSYGAEGWLRYPSKRLRQTGPTPAAALRALAATLTRTPPDSGGREP